LGIDDKTPLNKNRIFLTHFYESKKTGLSDDLALKEAATLTFFIDELKSSNVIT
jgi:hypothetical protein